MAIKVTCGACGVTLSTPDSSAGKRAKCPKCQSIIEIPALDAPADAIDALASPEVDPTAASAPSDGNQQEQRKPCPQCGEMIISTAVKCHFCGAILDKSMAGILGTPENFGAPEWDKVRRGLSNIYGGIIVIVGCVLLILLGTIIYTVSEGMDGGDPPDALVALAMPVVLVIFGAGIIIIVGQARCMAVPDSSGAKGFATAAFICVMANILLSIVGRVADLAAIQGIGNLASSAGNILFILFIRQTARYLDEEDLATSATRFLIFCVVMFFGAIALGVLAGVTAAGGVAGVASVLLGILGLGAIIAGIACFVWYLRLIKTLMKSIEQRIAFN